MSASPPPALYPLRDSHVGLFWTASQEADGSVTYHASAPNGIGLSASWEDLAGGKYGGLEVLVPITWSSVEPPDSDNHAAAELAAQVVVLGALGGQVQQSITAAGGLLNSIIAQVRAQARLDAHETRDGG